MTFLRIHTLSLKNIRCFNEETITFERGNNTLLGQNGAGKSTILNSIGVGLYNNKYLNKMGLKTKELISYGEQKGSITLDFSTHLGDFRSYIEIHEKKTGKWIIQKKENGKYHDLSTSISESREKIIEIMGGIDEVAFKNAVSSPQGQLANLLDSTPGERQNMINKILGVQKYTDTADMLNKAIRVLTDKIENQYTILQRLDIITEDPQLLEEELQLKNKEVQSLKINATELEKTRKNVDNEVAKSEKIEKVKIGLHKNIKLNEEKIKLQQEKIVTIEKQKEKELKEFKEELPNEEKAKNLRNSLLEQRKILNDKISKQKLKVANYNKLQEDKTSLEKELTKLTDIYRVKQQESEKTFGKVSAEELQAKKDNITKELSRLIMEKKQVEDKIGNQQQLLLTYQNEATKVKSVINKLESSFQQIFAKVFEERHMLQELEQNTLKNLTERLTTKNNEKNKKQQQLTQNKTKIEQARQIIQLLEQTDAHNQKCPTCLQTFQGIDVTSLKNKHTQDVITLETLSKKLNLELQTIENELKKLEEDIKKSSERLNTLDLYIKRQEEHKANKIHLQKLDEQIAQLKLTITKLQKDIMKISVDRITELQKQEKTLENQIKKYRYLEKEIHELKGNINTTKNNLSKTKEKIAKLDIDNLQKMLSQLQESYNLIEEKRRRLDENILPLFTALKDMKEELHSLKTQTAEFRQDLNALPEINEEYVVRLKEQSRELGEKRGKILGQLEGLLTETIPRLKEQQLKAIENDKQKKETEAIINKYEKGTEKLRFISAILKKLPEKLLFSISQSVSSVMTHKVHSMLPEHGFDQVTLTSKGEIMISRRGHIVHPNELSGGEKTVIALALRIALAQHVAPLEFMILDEPTNHLDNERVNEFLEIIHQENLLGGNGQLLLVTHRQEFAKAATNVIQLYSDHTGHHIENNFNTDDEEDMIY